MWPVAPCSALTLARSCLAQVGFLIRRTRTDSSEFVDETGKTCLLDKARSDDMVFSLADPRNWTRVAFDLVIEPGREDLFNIYFANCEPRTEVSFNAYIAAWNPGPDYLSVGKSPLPTMYFLFTLCYIGCLVAFVHFMRKPDAEVKHLHYLMAAMVVVKIITLLVTVMRLHYMKTTGQGHGWNVIFYIVTFLKGVMLFTVVALIGMGWSSVHAHMNARDKRILIVIIGLQTISSVALIVTDEVTPGSQRWITWYDILRVVDIICCGAILFPIVWSIKHLKDASATDGKAAASQFKLKLFRQFYILVVAWIYFTRIIVFLMEATLAYRYVWVADFFGELSTLAFYMYAGYSFRPVSSNQFLRLVQHDSDDDDAGIEFTEVVTNNAVSPS